MQTVIRDLRRQDEKKARQFAEVGMHFSRYFTKSWKIHMFSRYFWNSSMQQASQVLAAYTEDGTLAGVLLAEMYGEPKIRQSRAKSVYVSLYQKVRSWRYGKEADAYGKINQEMLNAYQSTNHPEGEILFLAANPEIISHGVGTALVQELRRREPGKTVFLFTDSDCSYGFYDAKGFQRVAEQDAVLTFDGRRYPLTQFLYAKTL